jgi:murein L,D-transpeptidase YcbB/YkuD
MLHTESRENGKKGYGAIAVIAAVLILLAAGCTEILHQETEEERVARERLQLLSDSAQDAQQRLGQFLLTVPDTLLTDSLVYNYYNKGGQWLWVTADTTLLLHQADTLARFMAEKARSLAFAPEAFATEEILRDIDLFRTLRFDSAGVSPTDAMARLEMNLSRAFMRYAAGLRYGFVNPYVAFNHQDKRGAGYREVYNTEIELPGSNFLEEALSQRQAPIEYLNSLEPTDTIYKHLKDKLLTDTSTAGRTLAICNMERQRWRHKEKPQAGQRHIFVNIPSQQLWAIAPDSVFSMKICCGAWATKTPLLTSRVKLIELNPEWKIPFTIVRDEVSRHGGDSAYFARHRYYIVKSSTGDTVNPNSVTAEQLRSGGYRVTQYSGAGNSLGRIIFRFPNKFDVYMHDTNNRSAFNAERRTISHGCMRVERPYDLAKFLLPDADEWTLDKMRMSIDLPPLSDKGKEYLAKRKEEGDESPVRLVKTQPVTPTVLVEADYYTLYPNPTTGKWETWPDRYEYDKQIMKHIKPFLQR